MTQLAPFSESCTSRVRASTGDQRDGNPSRPNRHCDRKSSLVVVSQSFWSDEDRTSRV
jgi:hypothetical protein